MNKKQIAESLELIASFLEIKGESGFKVRAFQNAARELLSFDGDVAGGIRDGSLAEVDGIGKSTLKVISELAESGRSTLLAELRREVPPGLVEMLGISGLGVSKVRAIHSELGIVTVEELEEAARDGRLSKIPGFGRKTSDRVLRGIGFLRDVSESRLLHHARTEAHSIVEELRKIPGVLRAEVAGEVRRWNELVTRLDFVLAVDPSIYESTAIRQAPGVGNTHEGDGKLVVHLESGMEADVYTADLRSFGIQWLLATGSEEHLKDLRSLAGSVGVELSASGLKQNGETIWTPDEGDVYSTLGLPFIAPELREGRGEVEAARAGRLPDLVTLDDIRGFLHCHTNYSDGTTTIPEWAERCKAAGFGYIGITDHSLAAAYAGGLEEDAISAQHREIEAANSAIDDFRVLKGVEADILVNGGLDYSPEIRQSFDFMIASIHTRFDLTQREMTDRIMRAMEDPCMTVLGHPTGRLLLSRKSYDLDLKAVFQKAASTGVAIEINADPQRLDLDWRHVRDAVDAGAMISIGADAHSADSISNIELGVAMARKGWLSKEQVLNCMDVDGFIEHAERHRRAGKN